MMKRNIILLFLLPAQLIAGCQNEIDENAAVNPSVFTATIDGGEPATRTLLGNAASPTDPRDVLWKADDELIVGGATYWLSSGANTTTAILTPKVASQLAQKDPVTDKYEAYYPTLIYNGGTPTLRDTQTYEAPETVGSEKFVVASHLPMYAQSETTELSFKNLCAVLNFQLKGTDKVTKVKVTSTDPDKKLSGPFDVVETTSGAGDWYAKIKDSDPAASNQVTLNCGAEGVQLDAANETEFCIAVPAQTYLQNTLTVEVYGYKGSGSTEELLIPSFTNSVSDSQLKRSEIYESARNFTTVIAGGMVVQMTDPDIWIFNLYDYTLSRSEAKIWTGESATVKAFSSSTPPPDYTYSLSDPTLLSLSQTSGESTTLTAKTTPGETTLAVKASRLGIEKSDKTCKVTVQKLESMTLSYRGTPLNDGDVISLPLGTTSLVLGASLTAEVLYDDGINPGQRLENGWTWTSDDPSVCTVNPVTGDLQSVSPGTANITCTIAKGAGAGRVELTKTCKIEVLEPFSFVLSANSVTLWTGEISSPISAVSDADLISFTRTSLNILVTGTNNSSGTIITIEAGDIAETSAVIVAARKRIGLIEYVYRKTIDITVQMLESFLLSESSLTLAAGGAATLVPSALYHDGTTGGLPLDLSGETLLWDSSDPGVCTVDSGLVTAVGSGTATVFCTLTKGDVTITASCSVTVP